MFIDEIDSIAPKREENTGEAERRRVSQQLLSLMNGLETRGRVIIIAATNRPNALDSALRRPGRFDSIIMIPNPDNQTRKKIIQIHSEDKPLGSDVNLQRIADITDGFSGADTSAVANTAVSLVLHEYLAKYPTPEEAAKHASEAYVMIRHFEEAVRKIKTQRQMKSNETLSLSHFR
jgi:transitional endoplasmic reticulum ATPase